MDFWSSETEREKDAVFSLREFVRRTTYGLTNETLSRRIIKDKLYVEGYDYCETEYAMYVVDKDIDWNYHILKFYDMLDGYDIYDFNDKDEVERFLRYHEFNSEEIDHLFKFLRDKEEDDDWDYE